MDGREEKIAAGNKEPSQIMQEVIQIAAATPGSEYVILFCAWICVLDGESLLVTVYFKVFTMTSFCFFQTWKFCKRWWHIKWIPKAHKQYSIMCNSCYVKKTWGTNCVQITVLWTMDSFMWDVNNTYSMLKNSQDGWKLTKKRLHAVLDQVLVFGCENKWRRKWSNEEKRTTVNKLKQKTKHTRNEEKRK